MTERLQPGHLLRAEHGQVGPQLGEVLDDLNLRVGLVERGADARHVAQQADRLVDSGGREMQRVRHGEQHRVVQAEHHEQRDEHGGAPARRVDPLPLVELLRLYLQLLLVLRVLLLQVLHLHRQPAAGGHRPLRLDGKRERQQLEEDREQDDGSAVVFDLHIKKPQKVADQAPQKIKKIVHAENFPAFRVNACPFFQGRGRTRPG